MKNTLQKIIDQTMNAGADSCDVIVNAGEAMNLGTNNGKLDKFKVSKTEI